MRNRRLFTILSIILVMSLFLMTFFACAKPEEEPQVEEEFFDDQQYDLTYQEDEYTYRLNLDGNSNCVCYCYASESLVETRPDYMLDVSSGLISVSGFSFYVLEDGTTLMNKDSNGNAVPVPSNSVKSTSQLIKSGLEYEVRTTGIVDNVEVSIKYLIKFESKVTCNMKKYVTMNEYEYARGSYSIQNKRYIELTMNVKNTPKSCFYGYDYSSNFDFEDNILTDKENDKGLVRISFGMTAVNPFKFVQLYDDGHFKFVPSTYTVEESTYTKASYYNSTFVDNRVYFNEVTGDKYTFDLELSFDSSGKAAYKIKNCVLERHYRIESRDSLKKINYDIEKYKNLIGTHVQLYTSNNISFANDFKIYISYNEKNYEFEEDNLYIQEREEYDYILLKKEGIKFYIKFYPDGKWEWDEENMRIG